MADEDDVVAKEKAADEAFQRQLDARLADGGGDPGCHAGGAHEWLQLPAASYGESWADHSSVDFCARCSRRRRITIDFAGVVQEHTIGQKPQPLNTAEQRAFNKLHPKR